MSVRVCIITPVLNGEKYITEALASVVSQGSGAARIVVVDGGSSDATVALVSRFKNVSLEIMPGSGIYEAMNRGLELADGDFVGFLNCDDLYTPRAIETVLQTLERNRGVAVVSGGAEVFSNSPGAGDVTLAAYASPGDTALGLDNVMLGVPLLNARFYRLEMLKSLGGFDCRYSIAADRDLLIRMALGGVPELTVPDLLYRYRVHEGSLTMSGRPERNLQMARENMALARKYMVADRQHPGTGARAKRMYYDSVATALNAGMRGGRWAAAASVFREGACSESAGLFRMGGALWRKLRRRMRGLAGN